MTIDMAVSIASANAKISILAVLKERRGREEEGQLFVLLFKERGGDQS